MINYFFEIPIYRCSPEKFSDESNLVYENISADFRSICETLPDYDYTKNVQDSYARQAYNYEYNEVVGWMRLYIFGTQIRGEHYFETDLKNKDKYKKRINRGIRKKHFGEAEKAFELTIEKALKSHEIFDALIQELEKTNQEEAPFTKRYFDLQHLKNAGKFIDWRRLVDKM